MELKPVKNYKVPKYPDKKIILSNPDMLKLTPKRWTKNINTQIAFSSLLIMMLTACGPKYDNSNEGNIVGSDPTSEPGNTTVYVAPIFEYGDGRGSFGCVSVAPPAFLSEEEAYQVICDEAKKRGINFEKSNEVLKDIQIPVTYTFIEYKPNPDNPDEYIPVYPSKTKENGNLELDGYDESKKIAFEFVSVDDYRGWQGKSGIMSSVESYHVLDAAKTLREGIAEKENGKYIGVFYDPIASVDFTQSKASEKRKEASKELLRQQVADFIEWLKAMNVI